MNNHFQGFWGWLLGQRKSAWKREERVYFLKKKPE